MVKGMSGIIEIYKLCLNSSGYCQLETKKSEEIKLGETREKSVDQSLKLVGRLPGQLYRIIHSCMAEE